MEKHVPEEIPRDPRAYNLFPSAPTIKTEDFADAVTVLAETNPKVKDFDVKKIIDNSLVQSAVERGLDK
ncbi:MAG TPA: hypothetical protein VK457_15865 [Chloroflexota bacterium]|nr:hypothetical protein [Chloroflexota bacterium]